MRVLITPIGIYLGRVMKGIATIKPDLIYICTQKPVERELNEYQKILYNKWIKVTRKFSKNIVKKLSILYGEKYIKTIEIDIDDYLSTFKGLLRLVSSFDNTTEIYLDNTSTTYPFRVAALTLSIFFKNVKVVFTPASKPRMPEDYDRSRKEDKGLETRIIPTPKIDFSEIQTGLLKDILVKISARFKGKAPSVTDLLLELGMTNEKGNMIKISKLLDKLERYGCITTKKEGRIKKVELTMIGTSIAEVLKSTEEKA
jgi:predicted transcriptional regulator